MQTCMSKNAVNCNSVTVELPICGPKCFMIYINDLSTPVPLYKYVDDSTLFELCEMNSISLMQESVNIAAEWTNNNDMKINF